MNNVRLSQLPEVIRLSLMSGNVPLILSSPGLAKSSVVRSVADSFDLGEEKIKLKLIDIRAAQYNPTDFQGLIFKNNDKADFLPLGNLPVEGDDIPEGYDGFLIFLDEITHAPKAVQNALYKLILDRKVGNHNLHPNALIVAAGNLSTDNAFVEPMSTALVSRFNIIKMEINESNKPELLEDWSELWAAENINPSIIGYLNYRKEDIYTFNPDSQEPYACLRTWERVSNIMDLDGFVYHSSRDSHEYTKLRTFQALVAGCVGSAVANNFFAFLEVVCGLASFEDIVADPEGVYFEKSARNQYAITPVLAQNITKENIDQVYKFMKKNIDLEFQIIIMRMIIKRDTSFLGTAVGQKFVDVLIDTTR